MLNLTLNIATILLEGHAVAQLVEALVAGSISYGFTILPAAL